MEAVVNKIQRRFWGILAVCCAATVIFFGAYWHLMTAGICFIMYLASRDEDKDSNGK